MDPMAGIAAAGALITGWFLVQTYRTCDDCYEFDWSVRYRKGWWVRGFLQHGVPAKLCDACLARRKRRG